MAKINQPIASHAAAMRRAGRRERQRSDHLPTKTYMSPDNASPAKYTLARESATCSLSTR